jgi:hypothetical protein
MSLTRCASSLRKGDFDSPKSLWPKYRILDAARIFDFLRGQQREYGDKWLYGVDVNRLTSADANF